MRACWPALAPRGNQPLLLQEKIQEHKELSLVAAKEIPLARVSLGPFAVDCTEVRTFVCGKHDAIVAALFDRVLATCDAMAESQCEKYKVMLQRLQEKPTDVEGVKELEDYADGLNEGLANLSVDTKGTLDMWDVMDSFFFCAKPEQVTRKHEMLGWPKQLYDQVELLRQEVIDLRAQVTTSRPSIDCTRSARPPPNRRGARR